MKKKILIFWTDRVGDLINTSSFLKSLKFNYQNSEITLVCSKYNSVVANNYEFIDKVLIYDKSYNLLKYPVFLFWQIYIVEISLNVFGNVSCVFISCLFS